MYAVCICALWDCGPLVCGGGANPSWRPLARGMYAHVKDTDVGIHMYLLG